MDIHRNYSAIELFGLVGAVLAGVAPFLPWVTVTIAPGPISFAVTTTGLQGVGVFTLPLSIIAALVILTFGLDPDQAVTTGIVGVAIVLAAVRVLVALSPPIAPGVGLYLTIVGGLVLVIAGLVGYFPESAPEPTTPQ